MARKKEGTDLFVFLNGEKVGLLSRIAGGQLKLTYDAGWLASKLSRPLSLSMPLAETPYAGALVENFFDNLLPDSQPIKNRIQKQFGASSNKSFDLLWHVGRDCVGALQLYPEDLQFDVQTIEAEPLSEAEIADTLKNYRTMPLGMREDAEFRISVAGAQEKTAFLKHEGRWCRPRGATPTSHIFKLPIGRIEHSNMDLSSSVENEWLCQKIFQAFDMPVARTDMATFLDTKVLIVERFDRRWATDQSWLIRLPQEDMCQALNTPPALKYESDGGPGIEPIMKLLLSSNKSLEDRETFMKQVFLFWVLGAIDGHAKNFSIYLLRGGAFQLTPAYDIMSAYPLVAAGQLDQRKLTMAMALQGKNRHYQWEKMQRRHWLATAKRCRFPEIAMEKIITEILENLDPVIQKVENTLPKDFPDNIATPIFEGMREARRRILIGVGPR